MCTSPAPLLIFLEVILFTQEINYLSFSAKNCWRKQVFRRQKLKKQSKIVERLKESKLWRWRTYENHDHQTVSDLAKWWAYRFIDGVVPGIYGVRQIDTLLSNLGQNITVTRRTIVHTVHIHSRTAHWNAIVTFSVVDLPPSLYTMEECSTAIFLSYE